MAGKNFNFTKAARGTTIGRTSAAAQNTLLTLIGGSTQPVQPLALSMLDDHPEQHRYHMSQEDIDWLAESIKVMGVLQPIVVRNKPDGRYEILAGHRRSTAARQAGLTTIPSLVYTDLDDESATYIFHVTNLGQRSILPSEKAFGYQEVLRVLEAKGLLNGQTTAAIAQETGEDVRTIQRYQRLNQLTKGLLDAVDRGELSVRAAGELSYLPEKQQERVAQRIEEGEQITQQTARAMRDKSKRAQPAKQPPAIIKIKFAAIKEYLPENATEKEAPEYILEALEFWRDHKG